MMFGKKKKGMIDVRELARRGKVRKDEGDLPDFHANKEGFVDMSHPVNKADDGAVISSDSSISSMDFMNVSSGSSGFSSEADGYSKREVDAKMEKFDSMIYKLEQRIELLERKAGVETSSSDSSSVGVMGW